MTFRERYQIEQSWLGKVLIIDYYHSAMILKNPDRWGMRDTARYFGISLGLVCENIKIAKIIEDNPELKTKKYRKDVLRWIILNPSRIKST